MRAHKTSPIATMRARKATTALRDEWFARVDAYVRKLYAEWSKKNTKGHGPPTMIDLVVGATHPTTLAVQVLA